MIDRSFPPRKCEKFLMYQMVNKFIFYIAMLERAKSSAGMEKPLQ